MYPDVAFATITFDNSYARLPERFYQRIDPTPVAAPKLVRINDALARDLGLDPQILASPEVVAVLAGNTVAPTSLPIAMAYAGHQFGNFVPQLGDGRALLLGEINGRDLHLKGAGRTRFSRRGDGRAAIGPVLREFIISEAMAALGIPTTRTLAAVSTGELVYREQPLPGAVLARVAASHIRVGTFEYFAARGDTEGLRILTDYAIARHYPHCLETSHPYSAFFESVVEAQARLIAKWLLAGFIHGVMNTDNMTISGETIDYGPCAFMDAYNPKQVYSSIDALGRYAYANQPSIAHWNLACLAQALLPILSDSPAAAREQAEKGLDTFGPRFERAYLDGLVRKIGLAPEESNVVIAQDLLRLMAEHGADFTLTFRRLADAIDPATEAPLRALFRESNALDNWLPTWRERVRAEAATDLCAFNPLYIPRNHLVEEALRAATMQEDFRPFETLLDVVTRPYSEQPGRERYSLPPRPEEAVTQTFCGT